MEEKMERRSRELAERLASRSRQCPGLFLLESSEEFLAVAAHQGSGGEEALIQVLESYDRHPDVCHQAVNHWLLAQRLSGIHLTGSSGDERRRLRHSVREAMGNTAYTSKMTLPNQAKNRALSPPVGCSPGQGGDKPGSAPGCRVA